MRRILHHNLITNPKPSTVAGWSKFGNVELRMTSDQISAQARQIAVLQAQIQTMQQQQGGDSDE